MRWPPLSLRAKIMASVAAVVVLLGAATIGFIQVRLSATLKAELSQRGTIIARELAARGVDLVLTYNDLELHALVHSTQSANQDVRYAFVTDPKGRLLVHTFDQTGFPTELLSANLLGPGQGHSAKLLLTEEGPLLDVAAPIYDGKAGVAHVGMSYTHLAEAVATTIGWLVVGTGGVLTVGLLLAYLVAGLLTGPIHQLVHATRAVGRGALEYRAAIESRDEIGELGSAFNTMTEALQRSSNELLRRNAELSALNTIAAAASASLDLKELLEGVLGRVLAVMGLKAGWVFLRGDDPGRLPLVAHVGLSEQFARLESSLELGECICGRVLGEQRALVAEDLHYCTRVGPGATAAEGLCCHASVPLQAKERVLGVMNVASGSPRQFTREELELLTAIGHQIGIAIENARLFEQATERANQLATLNAIATVVNESPDPEEMLSRALDRVLELLHLEAGGVLLWSDEVGGLEYRAKQGFSPRLVRGVAGLQPGEGIAGRVFASGQPISLEDISEDPRLTRSVVREEGFRCFASVPVRCKGKVLGTLNVASRTRRRLPDKELALLVAVGQHLGVALENVRLVGEAGKIEVLRQLDRMKSEFIARASHELRTPVTSIRGYVETLLREDMALDPTTQLELFQDMDQISDRLTRLVHDLLNVSRIDVGKLEVRREEIPVATALGRTVRRLRRQASGHAFRVSVPRTLPPALADPDRLDDVLDNLLSNAVKYSPGRGTITVSARIREDDQGPGGMAVIRPSSEGRYLVISVADEGLGIPAGELDKLFQRFYQANDGSMARRWGIGLGLYLCKTYVEAMGGEIWAESELGKGSTFKFTLPAAGALERSQMPAGCSIGG